MTQNAPKERAGIDKRRVWDVLVETCGAREDGFEDFARSWPECIEYRFMGSLGMGGKVWIRSVFGYQPVYVSCYTEDQTRARTLAIFEANSRLAELFPAQSGLQDGSAPK